MIVDRKTFWVKITEVQPRDILRKKRKELDAEIGVPSWLKNKE